MYKGQYLPSTNKHLLNDKQVPFKELHIKTVYPSDLMTFMIMLIMMTTMATKMMIMSQSSTVLAFQ
jgi:hypothetical protein